MNILAILVAILALSGIALIVVGISLLAGTAWAFIAAGIAVTGIAAVLRRGVAPNG